MNTKVKVTVELFVDVNSAQSILSKFSETGLECRVLFEFPPQGLVKVESDINGAMNQPIQSNNIVDLVTSEDNAPPIDIDADSLIRKQKAETMGLKIGSPCYVPGVLSSQGVLIHISEDYSMFLIKMAPSSTAGVQANSHDSITFPVKVGEKIKWTELENIAAGIMPK